MLVIFEGLDRTGKTTQAKKFAEYIGALYVKEPEGTPFGALVWRLLKENELSPMAQYALFLAARSVIFHDVILPARAAGKSVVLDRSYLSSIVYQGMLGGVDQDVIIRTSSAVMLGVQPTGVLLFLRRFKDAPIENKYDRLVITPKMYIDATRLTGLPYGMVTQGTIDQVFTHVLEITDQWIKYQF